MKIVITAHTGRPMVPFLRENLRRAGVVSRSKLQQLSIALVGAAEMSRLHQQFMGIKGPTDVLTFPLESDARGRITSGEVVVCIPQARRQAGLRRIPARVEALLYALHGMLHLMGYDDRSAHAFRKMHAMEDQILTKLGFGPVFAKPATGGGRRR